VGDESSPTLFAIYHVNDIITQLQRFGCYIGYLLLWVSEIAELYFSNIFRINGSSSVVTDVCNWTHI